MAGMKTLFYLVASLICLSACNLAATPVVSSQPTPLPPNVRIVQQTASTTPKTTATPRATDTPQAPAAPETTPESLPAAVCPLESSSRKTQYDVRATLYYDQKRVEVAQRVVYSNQEADALETLALVVEANNWNNVFALEAVRVAGEDATYTLEGNRLTLALAQPLAPSCALAFELAFTLRLPRIASGITAIKGYFGYSERQINLSLWLPKVAARQAGAWVVHDFRAIGEQTVLEQADWQLELTVEEANDALVVAAVGVVTRLSPQQYQIVFKDARDLPLSLSHNYRVNRATTPSGTVVEMYSFPDAVRPIEGSFQDAAEHALLAAVQAAERFETLFGRSPYARLLVVQGDFPDGMEFSGLVYVSTNWFYQFKGGFDNYLTLITVHEISHQWWYAKVGNDAALLPWLDEALATYSEYVYIEHFHPNLRNWWWSFRVGYFNPQGAVDSTVYEFNNAREYINAVYLRGVQMLHNLRTDIGDEAFLRLLRDYASAGAGRIADATLFWSLFTPEQLARTQKTRETFFKTPQNP